MEGQIPMTNTRSTLLRRSRWEIKDDAVTFRTRFHTRIFRTMFPVRLVEPDIGLPIIPRVTLFLLVLLAE